MANTSFINIPAALRKTNRGIIPDNGIHPILFIVFFSLLSLNLAFSEHYKGASISLITTFVFIIFSRFSLPTNRTNTRLIPKTRQEAGLLGELSIISGINSVLSEAHIILHNVYIPNSRSRTSSTEIDLIILSPTNITVVEVKNVIGVIDARHTDLPWPVFRYKDEKYIQTEMRNPIRQTRIQKQVLQTWLRTKGIDIEVSGALAFPNPKTKILNYLHTEFPIARDKIDLASIVTIPCRKHINTNELAIALMNESNKLIAHTQRVIKSFKQ